MEEQKKYVAKVSDVCRFFWTYVRSHIALVVCILVFGAAGTIFQNVLAPIWYKNFVNAVAHVATLSDPSQALFTILLTAVGVRFIGILFSNIRYRAMCRFQPLVMHEINQDMMSRTLLHSYRFFSDTFSGALSRKIGRLNGNFEQLSDLLLMNMWQLIISLVGIFVVLCQHYLIAALLIAVWIAVYTAVKIWYTRHKMRSYAEFTRLDTISGGVMSDIFGNATTVKLFGREKDEVGRFAEADEHAIAQLKIHWSSTAQMDLGDAILNAALEVLILGFMIRGLVQGSLSVGDVVLLQSFLLVIFGQMSGLSWTIRRILELTGQVQEVLEIVNLPPEIADIPRAKKLRVTRGNIDFQDIHFTYRRQSDATPAVLRGFTLNIPAKEKVAFVGSSGAGKSTVTRLILRFFDVNSGKVLIDDQDISKVTQASLREQIGYVPQEPLLFHRSLRENISYGRPDASLKEVIEAAKKAHCHEFISSMPKGYETLVGERGVKLSGGERQRVAIARAILKNAPILVLDEATSSLDSESESLIQAALHELMKNKTVIVIAHRLSTIMEMDRIVVMEEGKVVDAGTHDELLQKVGIYQKLWNIQAGGFQPHLTLPSPSLGEGS